MAGAHLDSVPDGPGINDDGSGVAALLAIAARGTPVRLGFWGAEELGLHGSRAYVRGLPRAERRRLRAYVNLDMIGSPNGAALVYGSDDRVRDALSTAAGEVGREPAPTSIGGASDHAPFQAAGIPVGGLFSGAGELKTRAQARRFGGRAGRPFDPCYHRACDDAGNADAALAGRLAEAARLALLRLAR